MGRITWLRPPPKTAGPRRPITVKVLTSSGRTVYRHYHPEPQED